MLCKKKVHAALWVVGGLFLLLNIVTYYYQRHSYLERIKRWNTQDVEVRNKAVMYDQIQRALSRKRKYDCLSEQEKISSQLRGDYLPDGLTDSLDFTFTIPVQN